MPNYTKTADGRYLCKIDSITYKNITDIPDYGNWAIKQRYQDGRVCFWYGETTEINKLPKTYTIEDGSEAICRDTGDAYCYNGNTNEWVNIIT